MQINFMMAVSPSNRDALADAEFELCCHQQASPELPRPYV
jgi:hypothetical protein